MKKTLITTFAVFLLNFILQLIVTSATSENGSIVTSDPILLDSTHFSQTIIITNFENKTFEKILLNSQHGTINNIYHDNPIDISTLPNNQISINKIYPKSHASVTVILSNDKGGIPELVPLNHQDYSFTYIKSSDFRKKYLVDFLNLILTSLIVSVIFGLFTYYFDQQLSKSSLQLTELKNESKELEKKWDLKLEEANKNLLKSSVERDTVISKWEANSKEWEVKLKESNNKWTKLKIFLFKTLQDYREENRFYKELILELFKAKKNSEISEEFFKEEVTKKIKTYGTFKNLSNNIESIDVITSILRDKKDFNDEKVG